MKKILGLMLMAMLMIPAGAMAMKGMDHGSMEKMDHSKMKMDNGKKMDHSGMSMGGDMIMLQDVEVDGVMASGHLMDTSAKMAEHGMSMTHHIMVGFMNSEGEAINKGQVAVKVEGPNGKVGKANKMMGMDGQFGADITLRQKGMYKFMIGTKLADGKKRMYHMHYDNK